LGAIPATPADFEEVTMRNIRVGRAAGIALLIFGVAVVLFAFGFGP
jgi:hypothetical protein